MSPAIKTLLEQVASWPEEDQEELADYASEIEARRAELYRLSDAEREGIKRGLKAMREDRFASDDRMAKIFEKTRSPRL